MTDPAQFHAIEILLSVAGGLIILLPGIIGFWLQKWIRYYITLCKLQIINAIHEVLFPWFLVQMQDATGAPALTPTPTPPFPIVVNLRFLK